MLTFPECTISSGRLFQLFTTLLLKNWCRCSQFLTSSRFNLKSCPLVFITGFIVSIGFEIDGQCTMSIWLIILNSCIKSPLSRRSSKVVSPIIDSLSWYERFLNSGINLVALLCTFSCILMSAFKYGLQTGTENSNFLLNAT